MTQAAAYTVIIPARDEEATIERTLSAFGCGFANESREVIVVCNGCKDRTAQRAAKFDIQIKIVELGEAGKWRAINEGLARRLHSTVIIVDADISISGKALDALALHLQSGQIEAASPCVDFDLSDAGVAVRRYYRFFLEHSYLHELVGGAGVYGLSAKGVSRVMPLPPVMSDDGFVRAQIPTQLQSRLAHDEVGTSVVAKVRPPRTLIALLRSEARWRRGDRELRSLGYFAGRRSYERGGAKVSQRPLDAVVYYSVKILGRLMSLFEPLRTDRSWHLDRSSRD